MWHITRRFEFVNFSFVSYSQMQPNTVYCRRFGYRGPLDFRWDMKSTFLFLSLLISLASSEANPLAPAIITKLSPHDNNTISILLRNNSQADISTIILIATYPEGTKPGREFHTLKRRLRPNQEVSVYWIKRVHNSYDSKVDIFRVVFANGQQWTNPSISWSELNRR